MSTVTRRERERNQRKISIVDAAEKIFSSKGFDNVSMNDIAKEVELNRATIYLYFENKEALFFSVVLRIVSLLNKIVRKNVKTAVYTQKINVFGKSYYDFFNIYPQYTKIYNLFQSGRFDLSNLKTPLMNDVKEIINLQKELLDILVSAIKTIKGTGAISSDIDPVYSAILIITAVEKMLNPPPFLEKEFEKKHLNQYQNHDFINFVNQLIVTDPVKSSKINELKISKNQMERLKKG